MTAKELCAMIKENFSSGEEVKIGVVVPSGSVWSAKALYVSGTDKGDMLIMELDKGSIGLMVAEMIGSAKWKRQSGK
jgi:hypothetical protein